MLKKFGLILAFLAFALQGCTNKTAPNNPKMPYDSWYIQALYPHYMEVDVQYAIIITQDNQLYKTWLALTESTTSDGKWAANPGGFSSGINAYMDLPKHIGVCWLSYLDKKTYWVQFDIPLSVRKTMTESFELSPINNGEAPIIRYLKNVWIGLAPNASVTVWLGGNPLPDFSAPVIAKVQGIEMINNKNCNSGYDDPNDIPDISDEGKAWIKAHGLPKSW